MTAPSAGCDYCGLPLSHSEEAESSHSPRYCCFGCRLAASVAETGGEEGVSRWTMTKLGFSVFCSMNVMVFTFFLWSYDDQQIPQQAQVFYDLARYVCLLFTAPVVLLLGGPLVEDALAELAERRMSTSWLLLAGVVASFVYSIWSVFTNHGHVYFEVACIVLVAVTLGRWLEATGKLKTTAALRLLQNLLPDRVRVTREEQEIELPLTEVQIGDQLRIIAGERIAIDGIVLRGGAAVDEQAVTGESIPLEKQPGDAVFSGSLNVDGQLIVQATSPGGAGTLQRLIEAVQEALFRKNRYQSLAEQWAAWFLPLVVVSAIFAFVLNLAWYDLPSALLAALAVVVMACPCALGLATPMALWSAVGKLARGQVLVRDSDALLQLAEARVLACDKTGTLTAGARVAATLIAPSAESSIWQIAGRLAAGSNHPLSHAILALAERNGFQPAVADDLQEIRSVAGRGVCAQSAELGPISLGSERWLAECDCVLPDDDGWKTFAAQPKPLVCLGWQGKIQALFALEESLREYGPEVIEQLKTEGWKVTILTGDRAARAQQVAELLQTEVQAELLPAGKLLAIQNLKQHGPVVMLGDGINDAPALAEADVGIALGCGADVSRWTAGLCLLGNDLSRIPWTIHLAQRTVATIRWNLFWAFIYNACGIPLAALGFLHPVLAAAAMVASSLLVVTNSLRLGQEEEGLGARGWGQGKESANNSAHIPNSDITTNLQPAMLPEPAVPAPSQPHP